VEFLDVNKSDNGWNFNRNPLFFAWSDPTSYLWTFYLQKFKLEIDPFISSSMDAFFLIKPYFKWTQILFFRVFEFIIDNSYLRIRTKLVVIPSCLAKGKLYTEVEVWTSYAPMVEEVVDRLFGLYEQFDDLCFFFPKNFYNPNMFYDSISSSLREIDKKAFPKIIPSDLITKPFKPPVDFTLLHSCIENDINFELLVPNWDKHLPKIIKRNEEEDETASSDSESEVEEFPVEPNHVPCEDFEFDEMRARTNKFPYEDHVRKFVKRGDVCVSVDCVCPSPPSRSS
jgi:hypothetical protein